MVVEVIFYQEEDDTCPVLEFLDSQPLTVRQRAYQRLEILRALGHTARRPLVENLGQGLYELRWHSGSVQYRILYFFYGQSVVVLTHALTKKRRIPVIDIGYALRRKSLFTSNPVAHTYHREFL